MKKFWIILAAVLFCLPSFAEVPTLENMILSVNLRAEKVVAGIYQRFDKFPDLKPVLEDFDQVFQENAGINPRTDIRNLGAMVITPEGQIKMLGYLEGNFNPSRILAEIEAAAQLIPPVARKKVEIIQFDKERVILITDQKSDRTMAAWFYSNNLLFFSEAEVVRQIIANKLQPQKQDEKRPGLQKELSVWVNTVKARALFEKSSNPALIPVIGILGMFNTLELTIDKSDLHMAFSCIDENTAQNLKTFLEGQIAGYRMFIDSQLKALQKPAKGPNWLPKAFSFLLGRSMAIMTKKSLEQTKVEYKGNQVWLSSSMPPITEGLLNPVTLGATGILAAIAIPNFQKARGKAQEKACFANQRILLGATEMYNMDHETMMNNIDPKNIQILVNEKYLKKAPQCPTGGQYISEGDIAKDGLIKCTIHGAVE